MASTNQVPITLQQTGYPPVMIMARMLADFQDMLPGDKRGVRLAFYEAQDGSLWAELKYLTTWAIERPRTALSRAEPTDRAVQLEELSAWAREQSKTVMPAGAGYPATASFETRQTKLKGMMETLVLHCLTEVLAQVCDPLPGCTAG